MDSSSHAGARATWLTGLWALALVVGAPAQQRSDEVEAAAEKESPPRAAPLVLLAPQDREIERVRRELSAELSGKSVAQPAGIPWSLWFWQQACRKAQSCDLSRDGAGTEIVVYLLEAAARAAAAGELHHLDLVDHTLGQLGLGTAFREKQLRGAWKKLARWKLGVQKRAGYPPITVGLDDRGKQTLFTVRAASLPSGAERAGAERRASEAAKRARRRTRKGVFDPDTVFRPEALAEAPSGFLVRAAPGKKAGEWWRGFLDGTKRHEGQVAQLWPVDSIGWFRHGASGEKRAELGIPDRNVFAVAQAWIVPEKTGLYSVYQKLDDGGMVFLDRALLSSTWGRSFHEHYAWEASVVHLEGGEAHLLEAVVFDLGGALNFEIHWRYAPDDLRSRIPGIPREVDPSRWINTPLDPRLDHRMAAALRRR